MNYAYQRVSTIKQDEKRQEISLNQFKIDKRYVDKLSGKNKDRPQLNKLMLDTTPGDQIYIESISRLGRNVDDLRYLCKYFSEKDVVVHFIKEGFNTEGNVYKFMLTILGAVAEMEREQIVERVNEGIQKAKKYGTRSGKPIGRPGVTLPSSFSKYYQKLQSKEITSAEFARLIEVSRPTLYRYIKLFEQKKAIIKE
ncbi:MAG: resolvase [Firmicutes bacterium HGW-Firmicutes-1]|jgi:DNA invertase Pin-like site-specific DNA recombinase|nr:MAG: resolvase [Firmicutes bacterium HGW-Firmicutes-1]